MDGITAAASAPGGLVANLAGGSGVSLTEAIGTLAEVMGAGVSVERLESQAGDVRDTWASIEVAQKELGYMPNVGLADGLAAEFEWVRGRLRG